MDYLSWHSRVQPELNHGGLWLRGGEPNTVARSEFDARPFRAMFVRLSTYFDTGYSFTHQILYQIAAGTDGVFPDLVYLPPRADAAVFDRDKVPWLLGTQTKKGAEEFDLIGFSNSIVQELLNVPTFLARSGIPLKKAERLARADLPLVILGGANALYSSSLWMDEAVVDGIFVGESDVAVRKILEICRDGKAQGAPKSEILSRLEGVPGFFQPDRPRPTKKNFALDLNRCEALEKGPIYYLDDPLGSSHLQISEGCPCFCSFCAESWERRPYRERNAVTLKEVALKLKAAMGLDTIEIYSFNFNMHSDFYRIIWDLAPHFRQIGLKSQRFDLLAHDPEMLKFQAVLGKTSLTCGLEGISPRLRKYLHKNLESDELHESLEAIFKNKTRELKMFLIATGHEEEQDFVALDDLLSHIREVRAKTGAQTRLIFSMTPLVRFPWTPLEFEDAFPVGHYERIIRKAAGRVRAAGFEFREAADLPEYWVSQILVRADRPGIGRAMKRAIEKTGFVYHREIPLGFMRAFEDALGEEGLSADGLLKGFDLEESRAKPWAQMDPGVKREYLWETLQTLRTYNEGDYCLGRSWTKAKCYHCGGCPTRFHVRDIVLAEQKRGFTLDQFKERWRKAQQAERKVSFLLDVRESGRGVPRKMVGVVLARALMLRVPGITPLYRGFAGAHWEDESHPVWITGEDRVSLYFDAAALPILEAALANPVILAEVNAELGSWATLTGFLPEGWAPRRLRFVSPAEPKLDPYLKSRGLKYTLRKKADMSYAYELIPQSVKKGIVLKVERGRVELESGTSGFVCDLEIGPKFDLAEFTREVLLTSKGASPWSLRIEALTR